VHDRPSVEVLGRSVELLCESTPQRAYCFRGVPRPAMNEVQSSPILDQHCEREPAARTLCPLCYRRFLPFGSGVVTLRHAAHNRSGRLARLLE
jgi:hypothetical protein